MSVRLNFHTVQGVLIPKEVYSTVKIDWCPLLKNTNLELVSTDCMSDSDQILGIELYNYTDELDDEKLGKTTKLEVRSDETLKREIKIFLYKIGIEMNNLEYGIFCFTDMG